jgi:ATP-dependent 26S proteasome regulatory subunit
LNSKKGFIFAGDPGNGKTLFLKILAKETEATCVLVPFDEFKNTREIFELARELAPTILILEDIDLLGVDRDQTAGNPDLGSLMNELDGIVENREIVVIATTNRLEKVEKALQNRPGRFDRVYVISNPDFQTRNALIAQFMRRIPNDITPEQVEVLAEEFTGYSSSYLKELVNSGFAEAILRDPKNPVLKFCDMEAMVGILKKKNGKGPIGFVPPATAGKV